MKKTYKLENLDCANCAAKMETAINKCGLLQHQFHVSENDN